jgi:hypothetical protein
VAGHPSQVRLARFLAEVETVAAPMMAAGQGRVAVELIVGLPSAVRVMSGGRDLDNYLFPVAQRLGPGRLAAVFGRKIHGPSGLAVGPAEPETTTTPPRITIRMAGSYARTPVEADPGRGPSPALPRWGEGDIRGHGLLGDQERRQLP